MKKLLLIFLLLISSSCYLLKPNSVNKYQYRAWISPDFDNGKKMILSMQTVNMYSSWGYTINFNEHNYGEFITASPQIQSPMGLAPEVESSAYGQLSLNKSDKCHLIFFFYDKREEFLIKIKDNLVRIKPLTKTHYIHFDDEPTHLIPENTLTIKMNRKLPHTINDQLLKLNSKRLQLALGDYRRFNLTSYSKWDKYAHISTPTNPKYTPSPRDTSIFYFFELKSNFGKVDRLLRTVNSNTQPASSKYRYEYNFLMGDTIYCCEKDAGPIGVKIVLPEDQNPYKRMNLYREGIDFEIKEPQEVKILITDTKGETVKEILLHCNASGKISYQWDGIKDDGSMAAPGAYSYRIMSGDSRLGIGTFLLR